MCNWHRRHSACPALEAGGFFGFRCGWGMGRLFQVATGFHALLRMTAAQRAHCERRAAYHNGIMMLIVPLAVCAPTGLCQMPKRFDMFTTSHSVLNPEVFETQNKRRRGGNSSAPRALPSASDILACYAPWHDDRMGAIQPIHGCAQETQAREGACCRPSASGQEPARPAFCAA
jgi:hypothetical protein